MKSMVKSSCLAVITILMMAIFGMTAAASEDDNSLYALGINTEGASVSPDFSYDVWEYDVTVPAGTQELSLSPITSNENATVAVEGAQLAEDGSGTVNINVTAPNGAVHTYVLNVRPDATTIAVAPQTEAPVPATEVPIEPETQPQTEEPIDDTQYVKVDKNTIQEAESTINSLKSEIAQQKETLSLYTKIVYGLIAAAVVLLFIVINQILRKRDLKAELNDYRSYGYSRPDQPRMAKEPSKKELKAQEKAAKQAERQSAKQGKHAADTRSRGADQMQGRPAGQMQGRPAGQAQGRPAGQAQGRPATQMPMNQGRPAGRGIEVTPQTSRKPRQMPEYTPQMPEEESGNTVRPAQEAAKVAAAAKTQEAKAPAAKTQASKAQAGKAPRKAGAPTGENASGKSVEIDMIDL